MKPALQWPFAAVLVTAAFFLLNAAWIPSKALLAQFLLERSWVHTTQGDADAKPWPWADTRPVAVLEVPELDIRQIVLSGTSGRNLAFGPTLLTSAQQQDLVLSGHRDTHFRFLEQLRQGQLIRLSTSTSSTLFQVQWLEVIDSGQQQLVLEPGTRRLTLTTCYPFDAISTGGSLRYVVTAIPVDQRQES